MLNGIILADGVTRWGSVASPKRLKRENKKMCPQKTKAMPILETDWLAPSVPSLQNRMSNTFLLTISYPGIFSWHPE